MVPGIVEVIAVLTEVPKKLLMEDFTENCGYYKIYCYIELQVKYI
jgi:hypothetical protein